MPSRRHHRSVPRAGSGPVATGVLRFDRALASALLSSVGMAVVVPALVGCEGDAPPPEPPARSLFGAVPDSIAPPPDDHETRLHFSDGTDASGLAFRHVPDRSSERYMPETMSAGVVLVDVNRDGAPDVFCVNSGSLVGDRPPDAVHRLFLNDGKGRFTDATDAWQVPTTGYGMGATAGDYDGDGWTDLLVTTYDVGERLLRNTGDRFVDVTEGSGIDTDRRWGTSVGFLDMENDGDLDIYVTRYIDYTRENALRCYANAIHVYCTPVLYDAVPDRLLRNDGDGTFTDVSREAGLPVHASKGLGLGIGDVDQDGDVDLYLANDTTANFLLVNDGRGNFTDVARAAGVAYSETGVEEAGMGADFSDYNHDDYLDIVCTNFQAETTCLYVQSSGFFFREVADVAGVGQTARARLSFGIDFLDADNDGDEDLLMANGHIEDNIGSYREDVSFEQINTLYENTGDGRLIDVTEDAGPALQDRQVSRGLATGDLDGDGDLDYVVANNGGTYQVGINETPDTGGFVSLWLEGASANRSAVGARLVAMVGERKLLRQVAGASSYLSRCDPRVHIGLGDADAVDEVTIHWPGGDVQTLRDLAGGRFYRVVQGQEPEVYVPGERTISP